MVNIIQQITIGIFFAFFIVVTGIKVANTLPKDGVLAGIYALSILGSCIGAIAFGCGLFNNHIKLKGGVK